MWVSSTGLEVVVELLATREGLCAARARRQSVYVHQVCLHVRLLNKPEVTHGTRKRPTSVGFDMMSESRATGEAFATDVTGERHLTTVVFTHVGFQVIGE